MRKQGQQLGIKRLAQGPGSDITLQILRFEQATFWSQAQHPTAWSLRVRNTFMNLRECHSLSAERCPGWRAVCFHLGGATLRQKGSFHLAQAKHNQTKVTPEMAAYKKSFFKITVCLHLGCCLDMLYNTYISSKHCFNCLTLKKSLQLNL